MSRTSISPQSLLNGWTLLISVCLTASCGDAEEARPGTTRYLFDERPSSSAMPGELVDPAIASLLESEEVWILNEEVQDHMWVADEPPFFDQPRKRWMANLRYQTAPDRRQVQLVEITETGERAPFLRERIGEVPEGQAVMGDGRVRRSSPRRDGRPGPLTLSYLAASSSLWNDLASVSADGEEIVPRQKIMREQSRRTMTAPAPWSVSWEVDVERSSRVQLSWGMNRRNIRASAAGLIAEPSQGGQVLARLVARTEGAGEVVLHEQLITAQGADQFHEVEADLDRFTGQEVELSVWFESKGAAAGVHAFLAEPLIDAERPQVAPRAPNVIILLLDTLRADRLGCYGWERAITPNIDALAARGVRFDQSMSAAPWTLPSHASLFSSLYVSEHGMWNEEALPDEAVTIAEVARDAGYLTAAFTEGGPCGKEYGFAQGFSVFETGQRDIRRTFKRASAWISEAKGPFMAFVQTYQVHSPYNPPDKWREKLVRPYTGELSRSVMPANHKWGRNAEGTRLGLEDERYLQDLYDAEIAYVDEQVGELLSWLTDQGLMEDTILLITADHGEEFGDHGQYGHGWSLYEEQLRVPLILYAKGRFEGGAVVTHPVHSVDVAPTLATLIGASPPSAWSGELLSVEEGARERPLFTPFFTRRGQLVSTAFRVGDQKFIVYPQDERYADTHQDKLLFDLKSDPLEQVNLFDEAAPDSARWMQLVGQLWERYPMRFEAESAGVNAELLKELEALGYVGDK